MKGPEWRKNERAKSEPQRGGMRKKVNEEGSNTACAGN